MRVLILFFRMHNKKLQDQGQWAHQHSKYQKGESKHKDMLEDQQGGDVGPQFWSILLIKNPPNFHHIPPYIIHICLILTLLCIFR